MSEADEAAKQDVRVRMKKEKEESEGEGSNKGKGKEEGKSKGKEEKGKGKENGGKEKEGGEGGGEGEKKEPTEMKGFVQIQKSGRPWIKLKVAEGETLGSIRTRLRKLHPGILYEFSFCDSDNFTCLRAQEEESAYGDWIHNDTKQLNLVPNTSMKKYGDGDGGGGEKKEGGEGGGGPSSAPSPTQVFYVGSAAGGDEDSYGEKVGEKTELPTFDFDLKLEELPPWEPPGPLEDKEEWYAFVRLHQLLRGYRLTEEGPEKVSAHVLKFERSEEVPDEDEWQNSLSDAFQVSSGSYVEWNSLESEEEYSFVKKGFTQVSFGIQAETFGALSASASQLRSNSKERSVRSSYTTGTYYFPRYTIHLDPDHKNSLGLCVNPRFEEEVRKIVEQHDAPLKQSEMLKQLLSKWGHIFSRSITIGGKLLCVIQTDYRSEEEENLKETSVDVDIEAKMITGGVKRETSEEERKAKSRDAQKTSFIAKGGDPRLSQNPREWIKTVTEPSTWDVIKLENVAPIWELLTDPDLKEYITKLVQGINSETSWQYLASRIGSTEQKIRTCFDSLVLALPESIPGEDLLTRFYGPWKCALFLCKTLEQWSQFPYKRMEVRTSVLSILSNYYISKTRSQDRSSKVLQPAMLLYYLVARSLNVEPRTDWLFDFSYPPVLGREAGKHKVKTTEKQAYLYGSTPQSFVDALYDCVWQLWHDSLPFFVWTPENFAALNKFLTALNPARTKGEIFRKPFSGTPKGYHSFVGWAINNDIYQEYKKIATGKVELAHAQRVVEAKVKKYHALIGTLAEVSESTAMKTLNQYRDFITELNGLHAPDSKNFKDKAKFYHEKYPLLDQEMVLTLTEVVAEKEYGAIDRGPTHHRDYVKFSVSEVLPALPAASLLILTADEVALLLKTALKQSIPDTSLPHFSSSGGIVMHAREYDPDNLGGPSSPQEKGPEYVVDGADMIPILDRKDSSLLLRDDGGL